MHMFIKDITSKFWGRISRKSMSIIILDIFNLKSDYTTITHKLQFEIWIKNFVTHWRGLYQAIYDRILIYRL